MAQKFSNFAQGTLQAAVAIGDTSLVVDPTNEAPSFPALGGGDNFICTIFDGVQAPEIVNVTASVNGTFTIARAQEGTTANTWDAGAIIRLAPTAAMLQAAADPVNPAASGLSGTSTDSFLIGTGSKIFNTQSGIAFIAGEFVMIASQANVANFMHGQITNYTGTALTVNVTDVGGAGTHADWNIGFSGTQGPQGATGASGGTGPQGTPGANGSNGANGVVAIANAGGSANAITATYVGSVSLTDTTLVAFVASAANSTTTPTFAPNGLTAHVITKRGGAALAAGDIPGQFAPCVVAYNAAHTRWELLNPQAVDLLRANNLSDVASTLAALGNLGGAPLASPSFTGNPTVPTQAPATNSTRAASTAYADAAVAAVTGRLVAGTPLVVSPIDNSAHSQAHGLSAAPVIIVAYLVCLTGELGYSAGDIIPISAANLNGSANSAFTVSSDTANIYYAGAAATSITNKAGGGSGNSTQANWELHAIPYTVS